MGHIVEPSRKKLVILFGLLLASHSSIAQNGYNYPRPEVPLAASGAAIPPSTGSAGVRPVVGFPTAASATFPSSPGYTGTVSPTTPSFGFTNPQRTGSTFSSTASGFAGRPASDIPSTGFPTASAIGKRPTIASRTGGIYGTTAPGLGSQQFPSTEQTEGDYSAIPGQPGVDYPIYAEVPQTRFDCDQQQYPGYYADVETQCQVFHICALNRTFSFLCPNGTVFSQETLVCVWYNMGNCESATSLYENNAFIYDYSKPTETQPTPGAYAAVGSRPPSTFPSNVRAPTGTGSGVFSANVRPTVPSASFSGVPAGVAPVGGTAFPSSATGSGRYTGPTNTATAGAFPTGPPTTAPAFGTTLRAGFAPIQEATFPSSQVSPTTANREYLPPRRS